MQDGRSGRPLTSVACRPEAGPVSALRRERKQVFAARKVHFTDAIWLAVSFYVGNTGSAGWTQSPRFPECAITHPSPVQRAAAGLRGRSPEPPAQGYAFILPPIAGNRLWRERITAAFSADSHSSLPGDSGRRYSGRYHFQNRLCRAISRCFKLATPGLGYPESRGHCHWISGGHGPGMPAQHGRPRSLAGQRIC